MHTSWLPEWGLTGVQYRRSVAAHELGHALVALSLPSLVAVRVEIFDNPRDGVHGGTYIGPAPGRDIDPIERAIESYAGAAAKARWLRHQERCWSRDIEHLVYLTAAGDRDAIARLPLSGRDHKNAQREAERAVDRQWSGITKGVPRFVRRNSLDHRQLQKLAR